MNHLLVGLFLALLICAASIKDSNQSPDELTILEDEIPEVRELQGDEVWVNPCSGANDGCITSNSDLVYSVILINQGVTLVTDRFLGSYKNVSLDTLTTKVDPFKISWTPSSLITYSDAQLGRLEDKVKAMKGLYYKSSSSSAYEFLKGKQEEIVVVANSEDKSVPYLYNFLKYLYTNVTTAYTAYEEASFANGLYNPTSGILQIAYLSEQQDLYSFGFAFNTCSKNQKWRSYASSMKSIIDEYTNNKDFENIMKAFKDAATKFATQETQNPNAPPYFFGPDGTLNITVNYLKSNMTAMEILTDIYFSDYTIDSATLSKNVIINDLSKVRGLSNFFKYDINMYSMLHCYLMVQPFLSRIESIFIEIINKATPTKYPSKSKVLVYGTNQYPFIALNKLFYYSTDKTKKAQKYYTRDTTKFIDYDTSYQFELWRNRTLQQESYYVTLREDFNFKLGNSSVVWSKTFPQFQSFISDFYNSIEYNVTERQYYCGN